jgi:hypothetical protein
MICRTQSPDSRSDNPQKWRVVLGPVKQVGHVEDYEREVVGGVYAWVYVPQKPLVVEHQSLLYACTGS